MSKTEAVKVLAETFGLPNEGQGLGIGFVSRGTVKKVGYVLIYDEAKDTYDKTDFPIDEYQEMAIRLINRMMLT